MTPMPLVRPLAAAALAAGLALAALPQPAHALISLSTSGIDVEIQCQASCPAAMPSGMPTSSHVPR